MVELLSAVSRNHPLQAEIELHQKLLNGIYLESFIHNFLEDVIKSVVVTPAKLLSARTRVIILAIKIN